MATLSDTALMKLKIVWLLPMILTASAPAADLKVGVARVNITPPTPFWLSGYAARTNPAPTVRTELWAKALAIQDPTGTRAVIVTTDLIGLPAEVSEAVAERLKREANLPRAA